MDTTLVGNILGIRENVGAAVPASTTSSDGAADGELVVSDLMYLNGIYFWALNALLKLDGKRTIGYSHGDLNL